MKTYYCKNCKKPFKRFPSQVGSGTCSKECGYKIRMPFKNSGQFKKGHIPWLKGKHLPKWIKRKLHIAHQKTTKGKGEKHWHWKGGLRSYHNDIARKVLLSNHIIPKCAICKLKTKRIHIHHLDRNWKNNNLNNLIFICLSCHIKLHHREDKSKYKHLCEWCGQIFYSRLTEQRFCGSSCVKKNWKMRAYLKKYKELVL